MRILPCPISSADTALLLSLTGRANLRSCCSRVAHGPDEQDEETGKFYITLNPDRFSAPHVRFQLCNLEFL